MILRELFRQTGICSKEKQRRLNQESAHTQRVYPGKSLPLPLPPFLLTPVFAWPWIPYIAKDAFEFLYSCHSLPSIHYHAWFYMVLGLEPKAFCILNKHSTDQAISINPFSIFLYIEIFLFINDSSFIGSHERLHTGYTAAWMLCMGVKQYRKPIKDSWVLPQNKHYVKKRKNNKTQTIKPLMRQLQNQPELFASFTIYHLVFETNKISNLSQTKPN